MRKNFFFGSTNGGAPYSHMFTCMTHFVLSVDLTRCILCCLNATQTGSITDRIIASARVCLTNIQRSDNPLTPNDSYSGRTAPLTSKVTFYIFIQQIQILNILKMIHTLLFFLFQMQFVS